MGFFTEIRRDRVSNPLEINCYIATTRTKMATFRQLQPLHASLLVLLLVVVLSFSESTSAFGIIAQPLSQKSFTVMKAMKENDNTDVANDGKDDSFKVHTWNPLRLLVLRLGFTEPAWTSPLNYGKKEGTFRCAYCGKDLFASNAKYDSGSGWPSFWRSIEDGSISYKREFDGRLECRCGRCTSHLGHVFLDGPLPSQVSSELLQESPRSDPRGRNSNGYLPRFCINGASLRYDETK
jgi:peptide-methionine (R)-S-oxide reductase